MKCSVYGDYIGTILVGPPVVAVGFARALLCLCEEVLCGGSFVFLCGVEMLVGSEVFVDVCLCAGRVGHGVV